MQPVPNEMAEVKIDKKIDISVHIQRDPGATQRNSTAFYFKTATDYYFIVANEEALEVKTFAAKDVNERTYLNYLFFSPDPLDKCPGTEEELKRFPLKIQK
jgi:hypothetical protein